MREPIHVRHLVLLVVLLLAAGCYSKIKKPLMTPEASLSPPLPSAIIDYDASEVSIDVTRVSTLIILRRFTNARCAVAPAKTVSQLGKAR